ncbi:MAG: hypothetical protein LAT62_03145 [Natronospirillum sp.]|uniref:hypothetical protein n=1 Tax=Natronospirillum sp. TaxID=2812955 RepID=UPI0025E008DD|nr:hypothetical protein [Natronospirillum sp.]MCH8550905.1 hypothetical protein [Natronospirillum sp.]
MNKLALMSLSGAVLVAIVGCNSDSGSGGSNSPEKRTSARSGMELNPSTDAAELSQLFAGSLGGDLPGGSSVGDLPIVATTLEARSSQPSNNAGVLFTELMTQIELVNEQRQRNLYARNGEEPNFGDMFEQLCETGSASYSQTDTLVSLDFSNCRTDLGSEGEIRITGGLSVAASSGNLDNAISDTCTDESISATFKADDLWYRFYDGSGNRVESVFIAADVTFSADEDCAAKTTSSSVSGPYFFVNVEGDWFGFYNFGFSVSLDESNASNPLTEGSVDFTFDSSELTGSLTIETTQDFAAFQDPGYPHAGEMKIRSGNNELVYTFPNLIDSPDPESEQVTITGRSDQSQVCQGQSSWAQMNNGQASCN